MSKPEAFVLSIFYKGFLCLQIIKPKTGNNESVYRIHLSAVRCYAEQKRSYKVRLL